MKKTTLILITLAIAIPTAIASLTFNKGWNLVSKADIGNMNNLKSEAGVDDIWMIDENNTSWCTVKNNHTPDGVELCDINKMSDYKDKVWVLANKEVRGGPFTFTVEDQDRLGNSISVQGTTAVTLFVPHNSSTINIQAKVDTTRADFSFDTNTCSAENTPTSLGPNLSSTMSLTYITGETSCLVTARNGDVTRNIEFKHCEENKVVGDSGKSCDDAGSPSNDGGSGNDNTGNAP